MGRFLIAVLVLALVGVAHPAEEPSLKQLEEQLQRIEERKQVIQGDFERGKLLVENAQLKYQLLTAQEEALRTKLKAIKEDK